ncbi:DNA helicase [Skeletonema marinoi]|uniref:DNA helicase n=1 Tax=Skeletonema marinoi TaxID=267567 RepID=A0AAD9DGG5_9STRA|nr:DNA helicase [Skeletonema marinoi]
MTSAEVALQEFVATQKRLLELELRAEEDASTAITTSTTSGRDSEANRGFFLRNVDVVDTSIGLYGRTVVTFGNASTEPSSNDSEGKNASSKLLPSHRLTVGDEVAVLAKNGKGSQFQSSKKSKSIGGVICARMKLVYLSKHQRTGGGAKDKKKEVLDNDNIDDDGEMLGGPPPYSIVPKSSAEVHKKMVVSLDNLEKQGVNHSVAREIITAAFEPNNPNYKVDLPSSRVEALEKEYNLDSTNLDYSQKEAIIFALSSNCPISLIHGPPGTGKTTTVANLIRCAVRCLGWKVLVTAPSNVAVDNVLERIMQIEENENKRGNKRRANKSSKTKIKAVRLGHPARIQQGIQKYSLESLVQASDGTEIVRDCRNEMNDHLRTLSNPKSRSSEKRIAYREMKSLRKEIRSREEKVVGQVLRDSNVVLATNVGAASSVLNRMVDSRGDPILLICTVNEVKNGLGQTLFERLMTSYEKESSGCSKMLEVQYRMHQDIANWASKAMYHGKLLSHESVKERKLIDLPQVTANTNGAGTSNEGIEHTTLMLIDTTGCDMHETLNEAGSRYNEGEAGIVISHVNSLISLGLRAQDIAVITPYNGQVELLRKQLLPIIPKLEIRSVDGFQGGEREAVVLSLVRSSDRGGRDGIGFLRDARRLNVAVTRAKRHCAVICDVETVSQDKFIKGLMDWMEQNGQYLSAAEFETAEVDIDLANKIQTVPSQKKAFNKPAPTVKSKSPVAVVKGQPKSDNRTTSQKEIKSSPSEPKPKSQQTPESTNLPSSQRDLNDNSTAKRITLMERINHFSETKTKGDELALGKDLSDYDSVVAKELASKLGLGCCDQMGKPKLQAIDQQPEPDTIAAASTSAFAHLDLNDDDSSSDDDDNDNNRKPKDEPNNLLKQLALEREQRRKEQEQASQAKPTTSSSKNSKKKKKKGGQKVGGKQPQTKVDDVDDGLDDMAFLNAQIDQVQSSHGRKVEGTGNYRSIPKSQQGKKKNTAASSQLKAKLNSKSQDRKVKKKK